jgi:uncharacterized membrane protein
MFDEHLAILLFQSNNPKYSNVKRILDILVASIMLVVILPLFLCMFLCVIVALKLPNLKYIWPKEEEESAGAVATRSAWAPRKISP